MSKIKYAREALWSVQFLLRQLQAVQQAEADYCEGKFLPPLDIRSPQTLSKINPADQSVKDYYIYMVGKKPFFLAPGELNTSLAPSLRLKPDNIIFRITKEIHDNAVRFIVSEENGFLTLTQKSPEEATRAVLIENRRMIGSAVNLVEGYVTEARRAGYRLTPLTHKCKENTSTLDYVAQTAHAQAIAAELNKILGPEKAPGEDAAER